MRVFWLRKMKGLGWYVTDHQGVHISFKYRDYPTPYPIRYFGTKRQAEKAVRDAYPDALVGTGWK